MRVSSFSTALVAALSFIASPGAARPQDPPNAQVECDKIDKYTTSWFLGNVCKRPKASTCLFYTRGLSEKARRFSKAGGADMTTIWEMWARQQYDKRMVTTNPLRCIIQDKTLRGQYFAAMSKSMAIMCDVFATVMDPTPASPREDGIWGKVEFPTLKETGNEGCVNTVAGTSPDGTNVVDIWHRSIGCVSENHTNETTVVSGSATATAIATATADSAVVATQAQLEKREDSCGIENDADAAAFDEGGEFEVIW